jgi:hypothetical protein
MMAITSALLFKPIYSFIISSALLTWQIVGDPGCFACPLCFVMSIGTHYKLFGSSLGKQEITLVICEAKLF